MQKITPYLWFDKQAEEAATLYVDLFNVPTRHAARGVEGPSTSPATARAGRASRAPR